MPEFMDDRYEDCESVELGWVGEVGVIGQVRSANSEDPRDVRGHTHTANQLCL
jgi:hypothetical protein